MSTCPSLTLSLLTRDGEEDEARRSSAPRPCRRLVPFSISPPQQLLCASRVDVSAIVIQLKLGFVCNGNGVTVRHERQSGFFPDVVKASISTDPLLVKAARRDPVSRPPAWMMRQAGRYMAVYKKLAEKFPSFRERSETTDLIVEISLQPWRAFRPDGVILFSDIRTPLPAFGVPFDIDETRGPIIHNPIRSEEGLKALHPIELERLHFVAESLSILRKENHMSEMFAFHATMISNTTADQRFILTLQMMDANFISLTFKMNG